MSVRPVVDREKYDLTKRNLDHALSRAERAEAREVELRKILEGVDQVCKDSFRDAGYAPGEHYTVPVCPLCSGEALCEEECPAPDIRRALASPSPVAEAMGRVVEAVGRTVEAFRRESSKEEHAELAREVTAKWDALLAARKGEGADGEG